MWSIGELVASNARKFAGREALSLGSVAVSFDRLDDLVSRAAAVQRAAGVVKGDRVAVMGLNSPAWIIAAFGVWRLGAVVVPLNHKLAAAEVSFLLGHCQPRLWLLDGDFVPLARQVGWTLPLLTLDGMVDGVDSLERRLDQAGPFVAEAVAADDPAEILYTSGTTGKPKGCLHSHASAQLAGLSSNLAFAMSAHDRILLAMPVWHAFPLNNLLLGGTFVGARLVLSAEYHPLEFLKTIDQGRCSVVFGAPIALVMPLNAGIAVDDFDLSSVRAWVYGAGPIDPTTLERLRRHYRTGGFWHVFGMTETGPSGTALYPEEHDAKAGSIGRAAIPGCDVRVMRGDNVPAGPGETGEIWMKSHSMMLGYFMDPAATEASFVDGWYRTGDVARLDQDGYLFIVDRLKDMIVTGGENVYSKEVEDVVIRFPGVIEVAVVGLPDADWGETVTAAVVASGPLDMAALAAHCAAHLAGYKVPRQFRIVERMPRTPTGKIMKYALRAMMGSAEQ